VEDEEMEDQQDVPVMDVLARATQDVEEDFQPRPATRGPTDRLAIQRSPRTRSERIAVRQARLRTSLLGGDDS
jgi:hypothetical protein